jgi:hypothetical protein
MGSVAMLVARLLDPFVWLAALVVYGVGGGTPGSRIAP